MEKSLDRYYENIKKKLFFASAYNENRLLPVIFKAIRLKPANDDRYPKVWIDEFSGQISLDKDKLNLSFLSSKQRNTDLYGFKPPQYHIKNGRTALIGLGPDEKFILSILGRDDFVRTYAFEAGKLQVISSLRLGIKFLGILCSKEPRNFLKIEMKSPLSEYEFYLLKLPASRFFKANLFNHSDLLKIIE